MLAFTLFCDNSLDAFYHLWLEEADASFTKSSWNVNSSDHGTRVHCLSVHLQWARVQRTWLFLHWADIWLRPCVIQFQVTSLNASADCVEWNLFFQDTPEPTWLYRSQCWNSFISSATWVLKGHTVQQWFLSLSFTDWEFHRLPESFHRMMICKCWQTKVPCNLALRKMFRNLSTTLFSSA